MLRPAGGPRPYWGFADKFAWLEAVENAPGSASWWRHDAGCGRSCSRADGSRLCAATLKHVAGILGNAADLDGTRIFLGLATLATKASRHRATVSAAVLHLEHAGLIEAQLRGGEMGVPRHFATLYWLARPGFGQMQAAVPGGAEVHDWFTRRAQ